MQSIRNTQLDAFNPRVRGANKLSCLVRSDPHPALVQGAASTSPARLARRVPCPHPPCALEPGRLSVQVRSTRSRHLPPAHLFFLALRSHPPTAKSKPPLLVLVALLCSSIAEASSRLHSAPPWPFRRGEVVVAARRRICSMSSTRCPPETARTSEPSTSRLMPLPAHANSQSD
jgi:hypothetical protein